jgi:glyoxylase-like metal-dependent hydrolase (beta-lactamase superfamily II)
MAHVTVLLAGSPIRTNLGILGFSAVSLVETEGLRILVDVGHYGRRERLLRALAERRIDPVLVDHVVLTHLHWDHALNLDLFPEAEVHVGAAEIDRAEAPPASDPHTIRGSAAWLRARRTRAIAAPTTRLAEGVDLLLTPGHSPGHLAVCVREPDGPTVISGDAAPTARAWRLGRPDHVYDDAALARASVARLHDLRPVRVVPGHDAPFALRPDGIEPEPAEEAEFLFREDRERDFRVRAGELPARETYD